MGRDETRRESRGAQAGISWSNESRFGLLLPLWSRALWLALVAFSSLSRRFPLLSSHLIAFRLSEFSLLGAALLAFHLLIIAATKHELAALCATLIEQTSHLVGPQVWLGSHVGPLPLLGPN